MWTQIIEGITKNRASINISVIFNKDGEFYDRMEWNGIQPDSINSLIKNQLALYEKIDSFDADALVGDYELESDDVISADRKAFREDYIKYIQTKKAIDAGFGKADTAFTTLEATIKSTYKDEYADLIKLIGN